jgi:hypothetical protein
VRKEIVEGGGVPGTLVLSEKVLVSVGRPPPITSWRGTFTSDDRSVVESVRLAEPVPSGQDFAGARIDARWSPRTPDKGFLADSRAYANWAAAAIFFVVSNGLLVLVALIMWRRRVHLRRRLAAASPSVHVA